MSTEPSTPDRESTSRGHKEAAIVFARAMSFYYAGDLDRAIELLDRVVEVSQKEDAQRDGVACVAAHISLYKIHRSLGHDREAGEHFSQAVNLGASARRLKEF